MVTLADVFQQHAPSLTCTTFAKQLLPSHQASHPSCFALSHRGFRWAHVYSCAHCDHVDVSLPLLSQPSLPAMSRGQSSAVAQQAARAIVARSPLLCSPSPCPQNCVPFARSQQTLFYNILFRASAAAIADIGSATPARLGGQIGMMGVLPTWGRTLAYHPHVHYLVPAGAWNGTVWRYGRHHRFFLPVAALSILFRAKFRDALKQTDCFDANTRRRLDDKIGACIASSVGRGKVALKYLAAYLFRVAISNQRLVSCTEETVTFRYQPTGSQQSRLCSLVPSRIHTTLFAACLAQTALSKFAIMAFSVQGNAHNCSKLSLGSPRHKQHPQHHNPHTETKQVAETKVAPDIPDATRVCPHCGHPSTLDTSITYPHNNRGKPP